MTDDKKYNIEDFWPGAETLLDQHFQKKRGWTTFMKTIVFGLLLALVGGIFGYIYLNSTSGKVESKLTTQSNELVNSESNTSQKNNNEKVENKLADQQKSTSAIESKNQASSQSANQENRTKILLNRIENSNKSADYKNDNPSNKNSDQSPNGFSRSEKLGMNENQSLALKINSKSNTTENKQASNKRENTENLNQFEKPSWISNTSKLQSTRANDLFSLKAIQSQIVSSSNSTAEYLALLKPEELTNLSTIVLPDNNNKSNKSIFIKASAGVNYVNCNLSSTVYPEYVLRRKSEESAEFFSTYSLHVGIKKHRIGISTGIELNQYGEQIKYSNWLLGDIEKINSIVNYYTDSVANTFYYYNQGNEFNQTNISYFTDSTIVNDTTFEKGQIEKDLSTFSSKTLLSYFEVPLIFDYTIYSNSNISVSINTGASLGFLRATRGFYLSPELNEVFNLENNNSLRKTIVSGRIGGTFNWMINEKTSLFLQPNYRFNLQSTFNKSSSINQRYNSIGLQFGIMRGF
jgi:hypothetical protein